MKDTTLGNIPYTKQSAREDLDILHGYGPGGKMNHAYGDGYFANSLGDKYGMTVKELKEWSGWNNREESLDPEMADKYLNDPWFHSGIQHLCQAESPEQVLTLLTALEEGPPVVEITLTPDPRPPTFQERVRPWLMECFGEEISSDVQERCHRFLEESLELVQSLGCTEDEAHQLVDYVFNRPVGETPQEIGGVMVTLAALCLAINEDMHYAGEVELARIWTRVEKIREKQKSKPKCGPLPVDSPPEEEREQVALEAARKNLATSLRTWIGSDTIAEGLSSSFLKDFREGIEVLDPAPQEAELKAYRSGFVCGARMFCKEGTTFDQIQDSAHRIARLAVPHEGERLLESR